MSKAIVYLEDPDTKPLDFTFLDPVPSILEELKYLVYSSLFLLAKTTIGAKKSIYFKPRK